MNFEDRVHVDNQFTILLAAIRQLKTEVETKMSQLSDQLATVATTLTTLETNLTQLGTDLTAEIARLDAKIAAGNVTQADLDAINAINTRVGNLATAVTGLDTQATAAQ